MGLGWLGMACRLPHLALWAVSSNWSAIDLMRYTDSPRCSPQIGDWLASHVTAGPVLQEKGGMGRERACVFFSCYVHVSPDLFFSVSPFLFWRCLWFPVVQFCLSQRCMSETESWSSVLSLTGFTLHTVWTCLLLLTQFIIFFPLQLSNNEVIDGFLNVLLFIFLQVNIVLSNSTTLSPDSNC